MIKIIISGCNGRMGHVVEEICAADPQVNVVAGFDVLGSADRDFPVYAAPDQFTGEADAVIDFSHPAALTPLLSFCKSRCVAAVLATTGYSPEQLAEIDEAAKTVPVFRSANMSLGINVVIELIKRAAAVLDGYDIEIVERHHNRKVDAPSGTALMLADAAASDCPTSLTMSTSATASAIPATSRRSVYPPCAAVPLWVTTRLSLQAETKSLNCTTMLLPGKYLPMAR